MKILNLYCGIGGNRKLWGDEHKVVAVENNKDIAAVYQKFFPNDKVVVEDAHQYLLKHYKEFDFIWSSPPCQSHSVCNYFLKGQGIVRFPDMKLYEEIIFMQLHCKDIKWVVENVKPYYEPLQKPTAKLGRHLFWSNFEIEEININYVDIGTMNRSASKKSQRKAIIREAQIPELIDLHGLKDFKLPNKRQVLRNCVLPQLGKHILSCATKRSVSELKLSKAQSPNISLKESSLEDSQILSNDETSLNNNN